MKSAVMIGDSHSQLVFPFAKDELPFFYEEIISKPGWGVKKFMQEGIPQSLPPADVVIVALGGNNQDMDRRSYEQEVDRFLDVLKSKFKRIVWIGPYYSTDKSVNRRHTLTNIFLKLHLPISVGYIETYGIRDIPHRDGVHFNTDGYKEVVRRILPKLKAQSTGILPRVWLSHPKFVIPISTFATTLVLTFGLGGRNG
jgi:lysophospholipase L1-like esterase